MNYEELITKLEQLKESAERAEGLAPNNRDDFYYRRLCRHVDAMASTLNGWIEAWDR